jgi:hypothetical protein
MQFSFISIAAVASFVSATAAHMIMVDPPQWKGPAVASAPLAPDGSDWPCGGATPDETPSVTYVAGGIGFLQVMGSAAHGGGSGQMVITYDFPPTAKSEWRVLQSWEGDHPFKVDGNYMPADPNMTHEPIKFSIPKQLPGGKAVVAWSWFNRIGNREHYMKCSTVKIESEETNLSSLKTLPTMFRANSGNGCTVPENVDAIAFRNPGSNLVINGNYTPTKIDCDDSIAGTGGYISSDDHNPPETKVIASPDVGLQHVDSTPVDKSEKAPSYDSKTTPSSTQSAPAPVYTADVGLQHVDPTPVDKSEKAPSYGQSEKSYDSKTTPSSTQSAPAPVYTGEATASTCVEGTVTCNNDNTWSICGSGRTQKIGSVPNGLTCKDGEIKAAHSKRSIRFSHEHMRRRHKLM